MTDRKRDLSGFGNLPPPPRTSHAPVSDVTESTPVSASHPRPKATGSRAGKGTSRSTGRPAPQSRRRITLSLPTGVARRLRETADSEDRFYLDIIGRAFANHRGALESEFAHLVPESPLGGSPLHRRRPPGRVQVALVVPAEGLAQLDEAAEVVGLDRSSYVAELLERELT